MYIKKSLVTLVIAIFAVFFFMMPAGDANAGLECPVGFDDCDCDGTCEMNVLSDPSNCGKCGNVCASKNCINGSCIPVIGGLVPCGRLFDDPGTVWSEQEDCKLCHTVVLANSFIDYLIEIAALITILALVIGGILYASSTGDAGKVTIAKTAVKKSLCGFVIILIAWIVVNTAMVLFGFSDPFGDGSWKKFDCELISGSITNYYCGDGSVDNPNDDGIAEMCDPKEPKNSFINRTGGTIEEWVEAIYACDPVTCTSGCAGDPLASEIGKGCYEPILADGSTGSTCQKGIYICDFTLDSPAVICKNTYNNPAYKLAENYCSDVYDYCCSFKEGEITLNEARTDINDLGATRIKHPEAWTDSGANPAFHCDDVCKNAGQICVGVGLTDSVIATGCLGVTCHAGSSCTGNTGNIDCRQSFPFTRAGDHNKCTLCSGVPCTYEEVNSPYYVGYSSCLCF
ncbi:hypothetical protein KAI56_00110 [Candidatus Parcubacteria bacterium]|nr:hypothetical protein [Candidatus Parcubacteria bacterium]